MSNVLMQEIPPGKKNYRIFKLSFSSNPTLADGQSEVDTICNIFFKRKYITTHLGRKDN
jgi:hypothetical protein